MFCCLKTVLQRLAQCFTFFFKQIFLFKLNCACVLKKYKDIEGTVKIEEVNGDELVKRFAEEMEEMLGRKMKAVKVIIMHAE